MKQNVTTGLLTFYHIHHYGAALQAAATKWSVEALGASCDIIHYYVNQNNALFRRPEGLGSALSDVHTALHYPALKRRYQRFDAFERDVLCVGERLYKSLDELRDAHLPYDLLISGSDQIWNPLIFPDGQFDPVFFGQFSDARKIAYAPSFGLPRLPDGMSLELQHYLASFSHLSVREKSGQEILHSVTGREVPVVLDPVLLRTADEWSTAASPDAVCPAPYLLCYFIHPPAMLLPYVRLLSRTLGLPVVQLCGVRRKAVPGAHCVLDAGPAEFVRLFHDAAFVLTNSFHGTAFSVLFQKPFFTAVSPKEQSEPEKSRSYHLLQRLGITERIIGTGHTAAPDAPIDWNAVTDTLYAERVFSLSYLRQALFPTAKPVADADAFCSPAPALSAVPTSTNSGAGAIEPDRSRWSVPQLASHEHCTGCTACQSVCPKGAIVMERDEEGFSFPRIRSEMCVRCGRCAAVCPVLHPMPSGQNPAVFAAWNPDPIIRRDSTSGGVFSALAGYVLDAGGVVFGAALDGQQRVRHTACFRKEELWRLRGSKYVQSDLNGVFHTVRNALKTRPVLFSGTPCQVDGLYRFLGSRPDNLITCDIVCHGVPSPGVWEDMVNLMQREQGMELRAVRFRNKVTGWQQPHFTAVYGRGLVNSRPLYETEYGRAFGRAMFLRRSCHHCPYASMNRPGDFTLGDFWNLDEYPEETDRGISLLMVNTVHGSYVFDQLSLVHKPATVRQALQSNPNLSAATPMPPIRNAFFADYAIEPFEKVRKRFLTLPPLPLRIVRKAVPAPLKTAVRRLLRRPR